MTGQGLPNILLVEYTRQALASLAGVKHLVEAATPTMDNSLAWLV